MEKIFFENLSEDHKKRTSYIDGRSELFETKIFKIEPNKEFRRDEKNILAISRDPGSANALLPVIEKLTESEIIRITAIVDGRAEEIFEKKFKTEDISPSPMILGADKSFKAPDVILMDLSNSEIGLDTYAFANFPEIPKVVVEDYYSTVKKLLLILQKRNLLMPEKICVMDKGAKEIIIKEFPELEENIEVTGQPSFDRLAKENTSEISYRVREKIGLKSSDKLVSFMSTIDEPEKIIQLADALKKIDQDFYFIFRRHPRDNESYETFKKILTNAGVKLLDSNQFSTDEIAAASDIILTTWSVEGLNGIYRRKPTVHIIDKNFSVPPNLELPIIPVKLGASIGAEKMEDLIEILPKLLDSESPLNESLREKMNENYFADGKNAERVAAIVNKIIEK